MLVLVVLFIAFVLVVAAANFGKSLSLVPPLRAVVGPYHEQRQLGGTQRVVRIVGRPS